jgi:hypothetical protein
MTLQQWANNGWLEPHVTSSEEITNLLAIVKTMESIEDTFFKKNISAVVSA